MWFKNLTLFRISDPRDRSPEQVAEALAAESFRPCGGLEPFSYGWSPPLGRAADRLVHAANGCVLVGLRREERVLPPAVVRDEVEARIARIEEGEGRAVRAKEKRRLRDEVTFELMPRAFTRSEVLHAYLAPRDGWLVVDSASPRRVEELVVTLARSLDGLAIDPFESEESPARTLTRWLGGDRLPAGLELLDECELRDPDKAGALVRCQRQALDSEEIRAHLRAHKQVHRLGLVFEERVAFALCADLTVRRVRFEGVNELGERDDIDELGRLDADFAYMTAELGRLLGRLREVFASG